MVFSRDSSLSYIDWFNYVSEHNFLVTLDEIINLPVGQTIEVLFLDRNFLDFCPEEDNVNIFQNLNRFYRGRYTKQNENSLIGRFEWYSTTGMNEFEETSFEFHCKEEGTNMYWPFTEDRLNFLADHWMYYQQDPEDNVLEEGQLGTMEDLRQRFYNECKHFTDINRASLVGWRGPMIKIDRVGLLPNLNMIENN
jgi:hypothetical protein